MTAARRSSRRTDRGRGGRRGWKIAAALAAACAAYAAWWVWTGAGDAIAPPLDDIDDASRDRLEDVLREADREERAR